jgi:hypothetical protein
MNATTREPDDLIQSAQKVEVPTAENDVFFIIPPHP